MLLDEIKKRMQAAMKAHDTVQKEILRVALGEISMAAVRGSGTSSDEEVTAILRKMLKSNEETLTHARTDEERATLSREMDVIRSLLPQSLSIDQIVAALDPVRDAIRAAGNDGQATGVAMKHLKASGAQVDGKDVAQAVKRVRS